MPRLSPLLNVMVTAARKAARQLKRDFGEVEHLQVTEKGPGDFVSRTDLAVEKALREELTKARPDFGLVMEEQGVVEGKDASHRWHIDPIDGTTNFIHGVPHVAISIGLEREGAPVAGLVYNPINDEMFVGERGQGAYLNDRRLRVSGRKELRTAVIGTGIPVADWDHQDDYVAQLAAVMPKVAGVRRFGSAALDLAWVAAGRFDGFWEHGLKSWDVCAGVLLVREAGGQVSDLAGGSNVLGGVGIVAGNQAIQPAMLKLLRGVKPAAKAAAAKT